jgi:hypothetical protein
MKDKINVEKLSNEDLQDMFAEAFREQVASKNNIDEFECTCKRDSNNPDVKIEVMIVGMAGTPYLEMFQKGKIKGADSVIIKKEGYKNTLKFKLEIKETLALNANDYLIVYKMV